MTEYEGCYVFTPGTAQTNGQVDRRPAKRRKILIQDEFMPFVPLLSGNENSTSVQNRFEIFQNAWNEQEKLFRDLLQSSNISTIDQVVSFVHAIDFAKTESKIPTGLIVAGPTINTDAVLFESITDRVKFGERVTVVNLDSAQIPNLKSALKYINRYASNQATDLDDEETTDDGQQGGRHLNYDLQILHRHVQLHSISRVVLSFQDSEAFEGGLLTDLIDVLSSWNDRIPFVLLFGIATSVDMFLDKLSRTTVKRLQCGRFDVTQLGKEEIFKAATSLEHPVGPWLGPSLSSAMLQRQKDYIHSVSAFVQSLNYVYMTHFFANPLSIFLNHHVACDSLEPEHCEAVRNLQSFQRFIERLIDDGDYKTAQELLSDDTLLYEMVQYKIREGHKRLRAIIDALEAICTFQSYLASKSVRLWSELYISGMSGKLQDSSLVNETLLSIRKLPSDALEDLLVKLSAFQIPGLSAVLEDLETLTSPLLQPLRSSHAIHRQTVRTTVVAQKVELSAQSSTLSPQDLAYSEIVDRTHDLVREYLRTTLVNPTDIFLHEILVYDLKSPLRDVFAPKSRAVVERALSSPHDYLGCDCCDGLGSALSATQPATAVLYQLYLESGALVNVADLWAAFFAILGKEDEEIEEKEHERIL
ncbi:hypothetical protein MMC22_002516 [Lobaria immixta]|nr:hypothetical protein [Lobaria immixta]